MTRGITSGRALLIIVGLIAVMAANATAEDAASKLASWMKGVWITGTGTYTIYTDDHYFVVSFEGDTTAPNIYCGASQVKYTNLGMARKQALRIRQMPGGENTTWKDDIFTGDGGETEFVIDTTLFKPGICNIKDGTIYDSITEVTDDYILLSTCNGDKIKVFKNGIYAYMPKDGGEFRSYRVEKF